jgi:ubiquinone/menaquinone biosynthesis C-methylase UbiE
MGSHRRPPRDGASGWDAYAPFYDWENARTFGRRDVRFWSGLASRARGRVLELGCGTGRLLMPIARSGALVIGVDRSAAMLARAHTRARRLPRRTRPGLGRADIRALPFPNGAFTLVVAPYGMLQSLTTDGDLEATLQEAARVLAPGGVLGVDLVPDLPAWDTYRRQVRLRGRLGRAAVTLVESVRQDRARGLTIFDEEYTRRVGRRTERHRFSLTFRTLAMTDMLARIDRAGFTVESVLGDYRGGPWDERADVWVVIARRRGR